MDLVVVTLLYSDICTVNFGPRVFVSALTLRLDKNIHTKRHCGTEICADFFTLSLYLNVKTKGKTLIIVIAWSSVSIFTSLSMESG